MQFDIITLFPDMFGSYINESILRRAQQANLITIHLHNIRDYATGKHNITDEPPFGGGSGMVLKPEPIFAATESIQDRDGSIEIENVPIILMSPQGRVFDQTVAEELAQHEQIVLICGRYEGFDERIRTHLATDEISIGDYVLTGGELGAMVIVDAVSRLVPGVLGKDDSAVHDSHSTGLLEGAHYTKPVSFRGWNVPDLLRSGKGVEIEQWRREQALRRTWERRPELLLTAALTPSDKQFLATLAQETVTKSSL